MSNKLRKAILATIGTVALAGVSNQALAWNAINVGTGIVDGITSTTQSITYAAPFKAWSDFGAGQNLSWAHTAKWLKVQIGSAADIAAGNTLGHVKVSITGVKTTAAAAPTNAAYWSGLTMWYTGANPVANGVSQNSYAQNLGPGEGPNGVEMVDVTGGYSTGIYDYPNYTLNDSPTGVTGGASSNVVLGHDGWVGYAHNFDTTVGSTPTSFTNSYGRDANGNPVPGATIYSGTSGGAQATTNNTATSAATGGASVFVDNLTRTAGLDLFGLKAGYYLFQTGGVCPDKDPRCLSDIAAPTPTSGAYAGPNAGSNARGFTFTVATVPVPVPAAIWLFGSALAGLGVVGRRKKQIS